MYNRLLLGALALAGLVQGAAAQVDTPNQTTQDTVSIPQVEIGSMPVTFTDAQPTLINGQLMVPVRAVAEQMGATLHWMPDDKEIEIVMPDQQTVQLTTNREWTDEFLGVEGRAERFTGAESGVRAMSLGSTEVVIIGDRSYMPLNDLATVLRSTGNWDQDSAIATIIANDEPSGVTPPTPENNNELPVYPKTDDDSDNPTDVHGPNSGEVPPDQAPYDDSSAPGGTAPDAGSPPMDDSATPGATYQDKPTILQPDTSFLNEPANASGTTEDHSLTDGTNPGTGNPGTNPTGVEVVPPKPSASDSSGAVIQVSP